MSEEQLPAANEQNDEVASPPLPVADAPTTDASPDTEVEPLVTAAAEAAVPAPPQQPDPEIEQILAADEPVAPDVAAAVTPAVAPAPVIDVSGRVGGDVNDGQDARLAWAARSDVGLIRPHNEDAFLVRAPLFAVCDGMGGHAAGEVASSIAVHTIAEQTPTMTPSDTDLGAAVESANSAIIEAASNGVGKPGMGCTASCALIDGNHLLIAHVGDSRVYLLSQGLLVRVTHDHSFVEELVDAGEITADEARVHPSRSIITRALGNDPDMYADHFTLELSQGDRVIICSDGLSSMIPDSHIEDIACTTPTPKQCTDRLVGAALAAGGHDNVTVVTIDVINDGLEEERKRAHRARILHWLAGAVGIIFLTMLLAAVFISKSWYVGESLGTVAVYRGIPGSLFGIRLSHLDSTTSVQISDLPESTQKLLLEGIPVPNEDAARDTVESYRDQIEEEKSRAAETADNAQAGAAAPETPEVQTKAAPEASQTAADAAEAAPEPTAEPSAAAESAGSEGGGA